MAKNTMENGRFSFDILEHFLNMPAEKGIARKRGELCSLLHLHTHSRNI